MSIESAVGGRIKDLETTVDQRFIESETTLARIEKTWTIEFQSRSVLVKVRLLVKLARPLSGRLPGGPMPFPNSQAGLDSNFAHPRDRCTLFYR